MTSLLDLSAEARAIEHQILKLAEESGGEIDAGLESYLAEVERSVAAKTDNYVYVMRSLETEAAKLKEQAKEFVAAAKALENARQAMKERITLAMNNRNSPRIHGNKWVFQLRRSSPSVEINVTHDRLPPDCVIIRTEYEIDKKRIKQLLEAGQEIDGCRLVENQALHMVVNNQHHEGKLE